jgi:hypothetical protein
MKDYPDAPRPINLRHSPYRVLDPTYHSFAFKEARWLDIGCKTCLG